MIHGCSIVLSTLFFNNNASHAIQAECLLLPELEGSLPRTNPLFLGERTVCAQRSNMERFVVDVLASNLVEVLVCPQVRVNMVESKRALFPETVSVC